mmetsp:Transcript_13358/g.27371  ORF Transcript_13358/g.27371 Transcript_13358/m.27371 type:complete len:330 (+) Transcript_13358:1031-2020(+)
MSQTVTGGPVTVSSSCLWYLSFPPWMRNHLLFQSLLTFEDLFHRYPCFTIPRLRSWFDSLTGLPTLCILLAARAAAFSGLCSSSSSSSSLPPPLGPRPAPSASAVVGSAVVFRALAEKPEPDEPTPTPTPDEPTARTDEGWGAKVLKLALLGFLVCIMSLEGNLGLGKKPWFSSISSWVFLAPQRRSVLANSRLASWSWPWRSRMLGSRMATRVWHWWKNPRLAYSPEQTRSTSWNFFLTSSWLRRLTSSNLTSSKRRLEAATAPSFSATTSGSALFLSRSILARLASYSSRNSCSSFLFFLTSLTSLFTNASMGAENVVSRDISSASL